MVWLQSGAQTSLIWFGQSDVLGFRYYKQGLDFGLLEQDPNTTPWRIRPAKVFFCLDQGEETLWPRSYPWDEELGRALFARLFDALDLTEIIGPRPKNYCFVEGYFGLLRCLARLEAPLPQPHLGPSLGLLPALLPLWAAWAKEETRLCFHYQNQRLSLGVLYKTEVLFCNQFEIYQSEDLVYYLLLTAKNHGFKPEETRVYGSGLWLEDAQLAQLILAYFPKIQTQAPDAWQGRYACPKNLPAQWLNPALGVLAWAKCL